MAAVARWKDILVPGRYVLPDGREVTYTPKDSRNASVQGRRMLANGLRIPICWEHDPDADPTKAAGPAWGKHPTAWLSLGYSGDIADYRVRGGGVLQGLHRFASERDAEQAAKVRHVSPRLNSHFRDSDGVEYPGLTVGHVAVTAVPVQHRQGEYLSRAGSGKARRCALDTVDLSFATRLSPGGSTVADEDKFKDSGGADESVKRITAALESGWGIRVGEVSTVDDLVTALKAIAAHVGDPVGADDEQPAGGVVPGESPPVMMSRAELDRREGYAKRDAADLDSRADKLFATGRVDGPNHRRLKAGLRAANLSAASYAADLTLKPLPVVAEIEAYERLPRGQFARKPSKDAPADLSRAAEPEQLAGTDGGMAAAREAMRRASGGTPAAK